MAARSASQSQTAIVTGGSRGLGRGVVEALTAQGVHVVALALRRRPLLEDVVRERWKS